MASLQAAEPSQAELEETAIAASMSSLAAVMRDRRVCLMGSDALANWVELLWTPSSLWSDELVASYFRSRPRAAEAIWLEPELLAVEDQRHDKRSNEFQCLCLLRRNRFVSAGVPCVDEAGHRVWLRYRDLLLNPAHAKVLAAFVQAKPRKRALGATRRAAGSPA